MQFIFISISSKYLFFYFKINKKNYLKIIIKLYFNLNYFFELVEDFIIVETSDL